MMKNIVNNFTNFVSLTSIFLLLTLASCNSKDRSETSYKDTTLENVDPDAITITENQFKSIARACG